MELQHNHGGGSLSEMNLTPLVDVMMVLMIIFMVTSNMDPAGIDLDLPDTTETLETKELPKLTVYMEKSGKITLSRGDAERHATDLDALPAMLRTHFPGITEANIKGDRKLTYERIMALLVKTRKGGIKKLNLLMDRVQGADDRGK